MVLYFPLTFCRISRRGKKTLSRLSSSSSEVWKPAGDNLLFFLFFLSLSHPLPIFPSVLLHPLNYFFFSLPARIRHKFRLTSLVAVKSVIFFFAVYFCRLEEEVFSSLLWSSIIVTFANFLIIRYLFISNLFSWREAFFSSCSACRGWIIHGEGFLRFSSLEEKLPEQSDSLVVSSSPFLDK